MQPTIVRRFVKSALVVLTIAFWAMLSQPAKAANAVPLSSCVTASSTLVIGQGGCGPSVYVDKSFTGASALGAITVASNGTLTVPNGANARLDLQAMDIQGAFQVGSTAKPFTGTLTLNFIEGATAAGGMVKGITVGSGGRLLLHGSTGIAKPGGKAPSWTYLKAPAGPPAVYGAGLGVASPVPANFTATLWVSDLVDWKPGQWVVVAGTDFSPDSAEFVRISSVSCGNKTSTGCVLRLDPTTPLKNYHYGGKAPDLGTAAFSNGKSQNYGVDERAEVGLISRNIRLTASVPTSGTPGVATAHGGEIMIMPGFAKVVIQGVEIEKFGKGRLGSYPVHFHQTGAVAPGSALIDSNSIHHSYNKCVTLHSTQGVTVSNNVCARAVGHLFYMEAGDETGNLLTGNLGIGAMSNAMSIASTNTAALASFWRGDYLANGTSSAPGNGYNGFNIPFTDDGGASGNSPNGIATTPSGFWITTLGNNTITGNSVAGCQALGRGFWLLPAASAAYATGTFANNRAHGCYTGFDTAADDGISGAALYTPQGTCLAGAGTATATNCDLVARLDDLTATRNRNRGIWVRASWYALHHARLATNRDGVSLVSSGGTEGSPPGEWSLLRDAVIVGISANNPDRFGPCPYAGQNGFGANAGCYEPAFGNGYPAPSWNLAGMMFYDGPARLENVRFVNFNKDITPYLTRADLNYLTNYVGTIPCQPQSLVYEGDAAMGWFQSNENSYPPTQYVQGLKFHNVDLRHQVYTQNVQLGCAVVTRTVGTTTVTGKTGSFRDGDKFTVILDRDSSLTGFQVVRSGTQTTGTTPVPGVYPISLNNIPFLAGPATADECHSTGQQDQLLEGRPTSLISPYSYATLEFSALTPPCNGMVGTGRNCTNNNVLIFTKDQKDYGGTMTFTDTVIDANSNATDYQCGGTATTDSPGVPGHACVALSGRNGNGIYEPKLANGLGYTVGATKGMPNFVSLMYGDASVPGGISPTNPFSARVGICYKNKGQSAPPASAFTVRKGSKAFAGPNGNAASLAPFFTPLQCSGLDNVMCGATTTAVVTATVGTGTAAHTVTQTVSVTNPACYTSYCPSAPFYAAGTVSATASALPRVSTTAALSDPTLCPRGECYFYDQSSGLLFINMVQDQPNAGGPYSSPLGSCNGSAGGDCAPDNFYSCPGPGCQLYTISVNTASYSTGSASDCTPYGGAVDYTQPYPTNLNRLAYTNGTAIRTMVTSTVAGYPHQALTNAPPGFCPVNKPATPDWPPAGAKGKKVLFTLSSSGTQIIGVPTMAGTNNVLLDPGTTYTFAASASTSCVTTTAAPSCTCQQYFAVNSVGMGYTTNPAAACCQLGGGATTLAAASSPFLCTGPNPPPVVPTFNLGMPSGMSATVSQVVTHGTGTATVTTTLLVTAQTSAAPKPFALQANQNYLLTAYLGSTCTPSASSPCTCRQPFTVNATNNGYTSKGNNNCCQIGSGKSNTLGIAAGFTCSGP